MSLLITLLADTLVAILLIATIVSSRRLSARITKMKGDEAAMRQTIADLVVGTTTAERAIVGLRAALDDCDRTLAGRLDIAERYCADLAVHVQAGEGVIARIAAIVSQTRGGRTAPTREAATPLREVFKPRTLPEADASAPNQDRLSASHAAAHAISERALERIRARAA